MLTCLVEVPSGSPDPTIQWFNPPGVNTGVSTNCISAHVCHRTFNPLCQSHAGQYTCRASATINSTMITREEPVLVGTVAGDT